MLGGPALFASGKSGVRFDLVCLDALELVRAASFPSVTNTKGRYTHLTREVVTGFVSHTTALVYWLSVRLFYPFGGVKKQWISDSVNKTITAHTGEGWATSKCGTAQRDDERSEPPACPPTYLRSTCGRVLPSDPCQPNTVYWKSPMTRHDPGLTQ